MATVPASEWLEDPKPVDYSPGRTGGRMPAEKRAEPALRVIAGHIEDRAGQWYLVACYEKPASANSALSRLRKNVHKLGIRLPNGYGWEFGTNDGELLARVNTGEDE